MAIDMAMESKSKEMQSMKANLREISFMAMVKLNTIMEWNIKGNGEEIIKMEMVK